MSERASEATGTEALQHAIALHREDRLDEAEAAYRRLLGTLPGNADAMHFLGLLMRQRGRHAEALDLMRRAVAVAPDYASARNNLGNLLCEAGRLEEAGVHLRRALELEPRDVRVLNNLGNIARAAGRSGEAIGHFQQAIDLAPAFPLPYENLGRLYIRAGDISQAHLYFCKAVTLDPTLTNSRQFVGMALCELGRHDEARAYYQQWIGVDPHNPIPRHLIGSVSASASAPRAADDYVRSIFDHFASTFDVHLERLQYRAPELVVNALKEAGLAGEGNTLLDAGCGTGLCGALLRPWARQLHGVDLSPKMLEHARGGGHYDELHESELTAHMRSRPGTYDAITCADTLCYFGELDAAAQAAFVALRPGGWFAFTLEALPAGGAADRFRLNGSGRYAHSGDYAQTVLAQAGFESIELRSDWLRMEAGKQVAGHVIMARRPAS
jgi:predicted TPR repeat methyltransferase